MSPTLRDVAEKANVSVSTVSRVLNKKNSKIPISEATRARVLQAVQEVGYRPNIAARHLASHKRFALIGVILPATVNDVLSHPFYMTLMRGIAKDCQESGHAVSIYFADTDDPATIEAVYHHILEIPASGYILTTTYLEDQLLPRLVENNIPFVHIGRKIRPDLPPTTFVDVDNYQGACDAVSHLLEKGHRKIAIISSTRSLNAGKERLRGYEETMKKAGLTPRPEWVVACDYSETAAYEKMNQLLEGDDPPTAVFTQSDLFAWGAIKAAWARGLRVPEDIGVIGFDDVSEMSQATLPLTTVRQPVFQLGETAAQLLLEKFSGQSEAKNIILQPQLIVRDST